MTTANTPTRLVRRRDSVRAWLSIGLASLALAWGIAGSLFAPTLLGPARRLTPEPVPLSGSLWLAVLFWTALPMVPAIASVLLGRSALRAIDRARGRMLGQGQALFGVMFGLLAVLMSATTTWANVWYPLSGGR